MSAQPDYSRGFRTDSPKPPPSNEPVARFGDPPPKKTVVNGPGRRMEFIETLRANPNDWAEYLPPPGRPGWSGSSSTRQLKDIEPRLETTTRSIGNGKYRIWARYLR